MHSLEPSALYELVERFSVTASLFAPGRVCLAEVRGHLRDQSGLVVRWKGSGLPWFLRPLDRIATRRYLVEIGDPSGVTTLAFAADLRFDLGFHSFRRVFLPSVVEYMKSGGFDRNPADAAEQDSTYAGLTFTWDSEGEEWWRTLTRYNRNCPPDLVSVLHEIDGGE